MVKSIMCEIFCCENKLPNIVMKGTRKYVFLKLCFLRKKLRKVQVHNIVYWYFCFGKNHSKQNIVELSLILISIRQSNHDRSTCHLHHYCSQYANLIVTIPPPQVTTLAGVFRITGPKVHSMHNYWLALTYKLVNKYVNIFHSRCKIFLLPSISPFVRLLVPLMYCGMDTFK